MKETTKDINNPARGWYEIYTFEAEEKFDAQECIWSLREDEAIALVRIGLSAFQARELSEEALENIGEILRFFREHEKDVILRLTYDMEGKGVEREPSSFSIVLQHLRQIAKQCRKEQWQIFLWQGVLLGSWGEMHGSKFLSERYLASLYEEIESFLPENTYFAVRTPVYIRKLLSAEELQKKEITVFDDGIFGSETNLGTYSETYCEKDGWKHAWKKEEELAFLETYCDQSPVGGEVVQGLERGIEEEVKELQRLHVTYLNKVHDAVVIERWKKTVWKQGLYQGCSGYDYIGAHMGYRFVIRKVWMTEKKNVENPIEIHINVENTGFSVLCQEAELLLEVISEEESHEILCREDPGSWKSGTVVHLCVPLPETKGDIYLSCRRKSDGRHIVFANENADDRVFLGHLQKH